MLAIQKMAKNKEQREWKKEIQAFRRETIVIKSQDVFCPSAP